jgi:hypothetical protein
VPRMTWAKRSRPSSSNSLQRPGPSAGSRGGVRENRQHGPGRTLERKSRTPRQSDCPPYRGPDHP